MEIPFKGQPNDAVQKSLSFGGSDGNVETSFVVEVVVVRESLVEKFPELDVARELPSNTVFVEQDTINSGALDVRKGIDCVLIRGVEKAVIPIGVFLALLLHVFVHGVTNLQPTYVLAGFYSSRIGGGNIVLPDPKRVQTVVALDGRPGMDLQELSPRVSDSHEHDGLE